VRGSLALERTTRAWALLHGRDFVTPEDIDLLLIPVLGHRIIFIPAFLAETRRLGRRETLEHFKQDLLERMPWVEPERSAREPALGPAT